MNTILIFPPPWFYYAPPAGIPALTSFLRVHGIDVVQLDWNVEFYDYLLSRPALEEARLRLMEFCRSAPQDGPMTENSFERLRKALTLIPVLPYAITGVEDAKSALRGQAGKIDQNLVLTSERILGKCFEILSAGFHPISIRGNNIEFSRRLVSLNDLVAFVENREMELFRRFFARKIEALSLSGPSVVGISVSCRTQLLMSLAIAKLVRSLPDVSHITVGGPFLSYYSLDREKFLPLFDYFDSIVVYDGEHALLGLVESIRDGQGLEACSNLLLRNGAQVVATDYSRVEDLESLPAPDYDGMPLDLYLSPRPVLSLPVSRGCYGKCTFCSYRSTYSSRWREESVESVVDKIEYLSKKYGTPFFFLAVAVIPPRSAVEISRLLIDRRLEIFWTCGTRMEAGFNAEACRIMGKAGCTRIDFGMESANQRVLDLMGKAVDASAYGGILDALYEEGILPYLYVITNFPTETAPEMGDTLNFIRARRNKILGFSYYDFQLSRHSEIWQNPERFNVRYTKKDEGEDLYFQPVEHYDAGIGPEAREQKREYLQALIADVRGLFRLANNEFVRKTYPSNFVHQMVLRAHGCLRPLRRPEDGEPVSWLETKPGRVRADIVASRFCRSLRVNGIERKIDGLTLFNPANYKHVMLNPHLVSLVDCFDGRRSVEKIASMAAQHFGRSREALLPKIIRVVRELHDSGFIDIDMEPSGSCRTQGE